MGPKHRKRIEERASQGVCLHCNRPVYRRGLCTVHYTRFRTALLEQPKKERASLEAKLIERGQVVEKRQGQRGVVNEFRIIAKG